MTRRTRLPEICETPVLPGEIEAPDSHDDSCNDVEGNYHPFLPFVSSPFQRIWARCGACPQGKRASRVGKKLPPSERPANSVTHQHRGFRVRQHLVCNTAEHNCG